MTAIVIGGGFSGAMTAAHLAARGISTLVLEPGELGRGVAYAREAGGLLLNTPSAMMSARPDEPGDFAGWLARRSITSPISPMFAPRALYGEYAGETARALGGEQLMQVAARAQAIEPGRDGFTVTCEDGRRFGASSVVLALGNAPPRRPACVPVGSPAYCDDPYRAIAMIGRDDPVALLGTGLTALDVIVGLRARGHRGRIVAASRRGLMPLAHDLSPREPIAVPRELIRQPRLHRVLAWWRRRLQWGVSEASLVAALRPHLPLIWKRLPSCDRARFLRHVRPRWDVTRHRAPPSVRAVADEAIAEGSLVIRAARLVATAPAGDGLRCTFGAHTAEVRWLVNCTGPERDLRAQRSPLVQALLARGLVEPDPLALGAAADDDGRLSDGLYCVGPWRAADLWESTAVPELRVQALHTAEAIAAASTARRAAATRA